MGRTISLDPRAQSQGANRHALGDTDVHSGNYERMVRDGSRGLTNPPR